MRTTSVASAFIVVSGLLGSACTVCWPDEPPRPSTFAPVGETTCTLDGDVGSRTFVIEALRVPIRSDEEGALPAVGFDLDGLTSNATDIDGCNAADLPGGLDNGFAVLNEAIADVFGQANVDVDAAIASEVADEVLALELVIDDWNGTSSDPCISVTLRGADLDSTPTLTPCSSVGNGTSADSLSIALLASGTALE